MLKQLKVQNYALIQNLNIEFDNDFSTLTGETGAGKSILLGALSLVLGSRADTSSLQNNENKCIVEATFSIDKYKLKYFFNENDLDYEANTIIRREINISGKSRAFINDTPTNLNTLKELATKLIDVHSQHQSLELNDNNFQLKVIDAIAQNTVLLNEYKATFKQFKKLSIELDELKEIAKTTAADYDYNQFQYNQLSNLNLASINQQSLEDDLKLLNNADTIKQNLSRCNSILSDSEFNTLDQLKTVKQELSAINSFYSDADSLIERISSISIELKDISQETEFASEKIEFNPNKAQQIKDTLDGLYEVMHKHQVDTIEELITLEQKFLAKTDKQTSVSEDIAKTEKELSDTTLLLNKQANELTKKRSQSILPFTKKITSQLTELGMSHAIFNVNIDSSSNYQPNGKDKVTFLFSANKNHPAQNIAKIASGGEISRLMLSIKSILSKSIALPTIIFDEIDTGVSGEIADKMASIMKRMAKNMQVISITHLPQIAAQGKNHYKIYKQEDSATVQTQITKLKNNERIDEIARLLSGKNITKEAIENAKALIN